MRDGDVLLVVATEIEREAILHVANGVQCSVEHSKDKTYFELGEIGGAFVCVVQSEMGSNSSGGSFQTVTSAIQDRSPSCVIMVGIAWGAKHDWTNTSPGDQEIGDILVSKQLADYGSRKVWTDEKGEARTIRRGLIVPGSSFILERLQAHRWKKSSVQFGLLLSGSELIDNLAYRNEVLGDFPEALGGEMEGYGVYLACNE